MIDLHTHTVFSDGDLIPSELVTRAVDKGLKGIGLADHGDISNIDFIIPRTVNIAKQLNQVLDIKVIPGIEITHVPPSLISNTVSKARSLGAKIVVVHKGLAKVVQGKAPEAVVVAFNHFFNDPVFDQLVQAFVDGSEITASGG